MNSYNTIYTFSCDLLMPHCRLALGMELKIKNVMFHIVKINTRSSPRKMVMFSHEITLVHLLIKVTVHLFIHKSHNLRYHSCLCGLCYTPKFNT